MTILELRPKSENRQLVTAVDADGSFAETDAAVYVEAVARLAVPIDPSIGMDLFSFHIVQPGPHPGRKPAGEGKIPFHIVAQ